MVETWKEQLQNKLIQSHGKTKGVKLSKKYQQAFSGSYMDECDVKTACSDINYFETLSEQYPLAMYLYLASDRSLHLRLFQWHRAVSLSDVLPMLENFDLRTENERTHKIRINGEQSIWVSDFLVIYAKGLCDVSKIGTLFQDAFSKVYSNRVENDGFNKLILGALLPWRDIMVLRAYAKYLLQVGFRFSQHYIEKALSGNPSIARDLVELFKVLHDPDVTGKAGKRAVKLEQQILEKLDCIESLDEDRIIQRFLDLIKATVRTNFFQETPDKKEKDYLALKLYSAAIPELPLPVPLYEIFVYSPRFEGIHIRNKKIARGGLRWSDRREDFRVEVLGLMKAQVVKNAVIVPSGAKGGFVLKALSPLANYETVKNEVVYCYQEFIRALLDLTDNICDGQYVSPNRVVCRDEPDPYLVVAADKGTATFSDLANRIAGEYDFWLGDAFASGGSAGYDHKKIGITARGAWESVKRHFHELKHDIDQNPFTVVGIGDMGGDVFGNGMLYSRNIKLIGAFDHRHIFIDPDPDPGISYQERERLFNLPASSWEDYNARLISRGGGVFKRSLKSITLTPQMKKALAVDAKALTPNELICVLLKAPVDLLFNGGIGTYVKSSQESNADVADRTNDYCRVNGNELRCKIVGEGGNLGFTQRGRVEYALQGGLIYTDFIDNSAGVDCSDHEVNLKILLDKEVVKGTLTSKNRNKILASLTQEVAELVLRDNFQQALAMSLSAFTAKEDLGIHTDYIKELESQGILKRRVEFLPDDKELTERKTAGLSLTRPELAILMAYAKIQIKQDILKSDLPEDGYFHDTLERAFPVSVRKKYREAMQEHTLRRDIIATQLANEVVNKMGITFVYRMQTETGASVEDIIRAYIIASHSFEIRELLTMIESLELRIPMDEQFKMFKNIHKLIYLATRWFLRGNYHQQNIREIISDFSVGIQSVEKLVPELMTGATKQYLESLTEKFIKLSLPKEVAQRIAAYRAIYTGLNIIEVANRHKMDLHKTARVYFAGGERMHLVWFRDQLANDLREDYWSSLTRLTLRDELDILQRALTVAILKDSGKEKDTHKLIDRWMNNNRKTVERWEKFLSVLHNSATVEYSMFFIAIHELIGLIMPMPSEGNFQSRINSYA
ncbi:NAD-glutamate dehydrogenase [Legionella spiritensis]|uniref:NAD-glutamate dehydrogenase n=1 Tax=Legionella spiritensis TaxID=452 RepID=UPI000F6ED6CE|nr:NAD-glutamate dehydrogenase domain-containing protein [Legionella spiritensis]VEG90902.1 NAD-glutamate dehydrogenase [Legionella spiritensis]